MKTLAAATLLFVLSGSASGGDPPAGMTHFNVICPANELLPQLDAAFHQCGHELEGASCDSFVSIFKKLLPEYDCQRSFDHTTGKDYIVPAVWLSGAAHEDFIGLLSKLKQLHARCLFASEEFRATLDGHLAEEYMEASKRKERNLGATCSGL